METSTWLVIVIVFVVGKRPDHIVDGSPTILTRFTKSELLRPVASTARLLRARLKSVSVLNIASPYRGGQHSGTQSRPAINANVARRLIGSPRSPASLAI